MSSSSHHTIPRPCPSVPFVKWIPYPMQSFAIGRRGRVIGVHHAPDRLCLGDLLLVVVLASLAPPTCRSPVLCLLLTLRPVRTLRQNRQLLLLSALEDVLQRELASSLQADVVQLVAFPCRVNPAIFADQYQRDPDQDPEESPRPRAERQGYGEKYDGRREPDCLGPGVLAGL